jgi:hypothetical protein
MHFRESCKQERALRFGPHFSFRGIPERIEDRDDIVEVLLGDCSISSTASVSPVLRALRNVSTFRKPTNRVCCCSLACK